MYRRFYHSKRRYVLWAMLVILAQGLLFYFAPDLATALERALFRTQVPVFVPLYFTAGYGIISRHAVISVGVGLLSWWTAPLLLLLQGRGQAVAGALPATFADGLIFGFTGFLAAYLTNVFIRRKIARP
ncbi:MAG: hypothetical protein HY673_23585 [Chloroflexi bacterium]|nr:hypothetical protein [Chloroflexota bacterium]